MSGPRELCRRRQKMGSHMPQIFSVAVPQGARKPPKEPTRREGRPDFDDLPQARAGWMDGFGALPQERGRDEATAAAEQCECQRHRWVIWPDSAASSNVNACTRGNFTRVPFTRVRVASQLLSGDTSLRHRGRDAVGRDPRRRDRDEGSENRKPSRFWRLSRTERNCAQRPNS